MPTFARGIPRDQRCLAPRIKRTITAEPKRELSEAIPRDRIIIQLLSRDGDNCYLCRQQSQEYELERIIPVSRGGTDHITNLALSCKTCNSNKSDKIIAFTIADRIPHLMDA